MKINIPSKNAMQKIMAADPENKMFSLNRYYSFLYKTVYLKRFKMMLKLLDGKTCDNLLDIGFGSGIFLPALSLKTKKLSGIDTHNYVNLIKEMAEDMKINAELKQGSVLNIPFPEKQFDCVTCLSVLEFIDDTDKAFSEIARIAAKDARIVIGAPVINKLTDLCYAAIGKKGQNRLHKSDHLKIIKSVKKYFDIEKITTLPFFLPLDYSLFFVLSAKKRRF